MAISRKATREISHFVKKEKEYVATFILGATTDTLDKDGVLQMATEQKSFTKEQIATGIEPLTGMIEQTPPMYSALKIKGKKLYQLAREGKTVERQARPITIYAFDLINEPYASDGLTTFQVRIRCSSGTYIRVLAQDLAKNLGTLGYVEALRRTEIAPYRIEEASRLEDLNSTNWIQKLIDVPEGGMLP